MTATARASRTARRPTRGSSALAVLLLAVATGASSLGTWVRATGVSALAGDVAVTVSGAKAAPVVPAAALVLAAAGAAVALAGRVGRWVVVAVVALAGLAVAGSAVAVLARPQSSATDAAATQTGIDHLAGAATTTAGPWVALAVGLVGVVTSVLLARSSPGWSAPSRRHEVARAASGGAAAPADQAPDERADWDALTRGSDPSEGP